jgi:hypothetical protein
MVMRSRSSKSFLERSGLKKTLTGPYPTAELNNGVWTTLPLTSPLPPAEHVLHTQGLPRPDRDLSDVWPPPSP